MPLLSCFTPCGMLEFSSEPSEGEKVYRAMLAGYTDPTTGKPTFDFTQGTYRESKLYATAMAVGAARIILRRAGDQLRAERSFDQLAAHEERFDVVPAPEATIAERRALLAARQKVADGPRFEAVMTTLQTLLGANFLAYRPIDTSEAFAHPSNPGAGPGLFSRPDIPARAIRILTPIARPSTFVSDSYSESNQDGSTIIRAGTNTQAGQSFTSIGGELHKATFFIKKTGAPTGNAVAKIYAHSGTFGTSSVATGAALTTSDPIDVTTLTGSFTLRDLTFSGANRVTLTRGTKYVIAIEYTGGSVGNHVDVGQDQSGTTHAGNSTTFNGSWSAGAAVDYCFSVHVAFAMEVAYENWNRSAAETRIVKGDRLAVDPGKWGCAEKITVLGGAGTGSNRTLLAYFERAHDTNTFATTGPVPLWMNTKRHVFVIVKAAAAVDVATRRKVDEEFRRLMRAPTTWSIVQPTTPGAATIGPFTLGSSPLGAVPVGTLPF